MKKINLAGTKIGNVINIIIDGNTFQKTFETPEGANAFYRLMHSARGGDKAALDELLGELNRRHKTIIKGILEQDADQNYYLKGIDIKMPEILANTFVDYLDNNFPTNALVNFWKLLITNPDIRVREDLFEFLQNYSFSITDNGYFIAYKAVEIKTETDLDIAAFVSSQYVKIKTWKKNPINYEVLKVTTTETETVDNPDYEYYGDIDDEDDENYGQDDNGEDEVIEQTTTKVELKLVAADANKDVFENFTVVGNLSELFKNIDSMTENRTVYQSKYNGAPKIEQVLGVPVKQERAKTNNDPKEECSDGLHVGSTKYVERFGSSSNDKILLVLVNPAHVVAVPKFENSKMRTCEYFPYADLAKKEDGTFDVVEQPYYEDDYMKYEATDLEKQIDALNILGAPTRVQLDYKKILEDRLVTIEDALAEN